MTLLLFSAIIFFIIVTGGAVFGDIGVAITSFFVGVLGFFVYPLLVILLYTSIVLVSGKKFLPVRWVLRIVVLLLVVFFIVHNATAEKFMGNGYGSYLNGCWNAATQNAQEGTGGGVILGLIAYPVRALLTLAGAYVLYAIALAGVLFWIAMGTPLKKICFPKSTRTPKAQAEGEEKEEGQSIPFDELPPAERPVMPAEEEETPVITPAQCDRFARIDARKRSRDILFDATPAETYRTNLIFDRDSAFNATNRQSSVKPYYPDQNTSPAQSESYAGDYASSVESDRPAMPRRVTERVNYGESEESFHYPKPSYRPSVSSQPSEPKVDYYENDVPVEQTQEEVFTREEPVIPSYPTPSQEENARKEESFRALFSRPTERTSFGGDFTRDGTQDFRSSRAQEDFSRERISPERTLFENNFTREPTEREELAQSRAIEGLDRAQPSDASLFDDDYDDEIEEVAPPVSREGIIPPVSRERTARMESTSLTRGNVTPAPVTPAPAPKKHVYRAYVRPNTEVFRRYNDAITVSPAEIEKNSNIIVETLAGFRVNAEVVKVTCGSSVTRYDIDIPPNVAVRTVIKYDEEIAMRLHARDGVNIYSNSEVGAVSIEVPNAVRATVGLRSILDADEYRNAKPNSLMFAIGKDVEGRNVCGNIVKMKHLLVAGSTGSGKSVCLNAMLVSLICKYSPEDLRIILIDPKKVEFAVYDGLPHLMINEIIADAQKAVMALNWAIKEMERRYELFQLKTKGGVSVRDIDEYNANRTEDENKLAKIVIVVDELADLMSVAKKDIEDRIQRLTQKARAAGVHLVIATQRPSVDVITGVIKSNLPTRIAFRVIQEVDSRTIVDTSGAEKLLGNGDMLYRTEGMFNCSRVQGAFLSSEELQSVIDEIKSSNEAYFDEEVADYINKTSAPESTMEGGDAEDGEAINPQYIKALAIAVQLGSASISLIQRKCSVGYNHAGKIMEWMEIMGYVSPFDGKAKARTVLLSKEEFEEKYGGLGE